MHSPGEIIDERYVLVRFLGLRDAGAVWDAEHQLSGRRVTIKLLAAELSGNADAEEALISESRAAAQIAHPGVVDVYDLGVTGDGSPYVVMESLRGETLADLLSRQGRLQTKDACEIALQVLSALESAHAAGILHRALGPRCVMLQPGRLPDDPSSVKLLDFGLCSSDLQPAPSSELDPYRAPEVSEGRPFDARADVFSVGAMLFQMVSGELPFADPPVRSRSNDGSSGADAERSLKIVAPHVPAGLAEIVDQALAQEPERRTPSAQELASLLRPFATPTSIPSVAPRDTQMPFLSPEARRSRGMARLERVVLGQSERAEASTSTVRSNLVLLELDWSKAATDAERNEPAGRLSAVSQGGGPSLGNPNALTSEELMEPRIPRPPRAPKSLANPRPARMRAIRSRRISMSDNLHRAAPATPKGSPPNEAALSTIATAIRHRGGAGWNAWTVAFLASLGVVAGLLIARLFHF